MQSDSRNRLDIGTKDKIFDTEAHHCTRTMDGRSTRNIQGNQQITFVGLVNKFRKGAEIFEIGYFGTFMISRPSLRHGGWRISVYTSDSITPLCHGVILLFYLPVPG